jgi:repressor LexA
MSNLTKRQKQILDFIIKNTDTYGFPPSISEIQEKFSFKSPNAVQDHLAALERKRYISRHPHKSRGIEILIHKNNKQENSNINSTEVPIVGRVTAGSPILAQENLEGTLAVDKSIIRNSNNVFALRVQGDSMINAGILDGDFVLVHQQPMANQGEIVVALIENEATLKRFYKEKNRIKLQPENENMSPIVVDPKDKNISIVGKVEGVIRKV